ncbi:MAG: STAS domain-containing protein [candidate division KSB1 bacterium]|nr:STAS domain-containing protein [candidate division KSB1 bacterium]
MNIEEREENGVIVFQLAGKIIGGPDATQLKERLHALIDAGRRNFLIDLSGVEWMNSTGLGLLINAFGVVHQTGGKLKLCGASEKIRHLLTITKLIGKFSLYDNRQDALAAF